MPKIPDAQQGFSANNLLPDATERPSGPLSTPATGARVQLGVLNEAQSEGVGATRRHRVTNEAIEHSDRG